MKCKRFEQIWFDERPPNKPLQQNQQRPYQARGFVPRSNFTAQNRPIQPVRQPNQSWQQSGFQRQQQPSLPATTYPLRQQNSTPPQLPYRQPQKLLEAAPAQTKQWQPRTAPVRAYYINEAGEQVEADVYLAGDTSGNQEQEQAPQEEYQTQEGVEMESYNVIQDEQQQPMGQFKHAPVNTAGYLCSSAFIGVADMKVVNEGRKVSGICAACGKEFASKSKLHEHIRRKKHFMTVVEEPIGNDAPDLEEFYEKISPIPSQALGSGLNYRGYTYLAVQLKLSKNGSLESTCWDTGCNSSLISRSFLMKHRPEIEIRKMATPLRIKGVGGRIESATDYVFLKLWIPGTDEDNDAKDCQAVIEREFHVVDSLEPNILVGTDIMLPERVSVDLGAKTLSIGTCGVTIPAHLRPRPGTYRTGQSVHIRGSIVIPPKSMNWVDVHQFPKLGRDFFFLPDEHDFLSMYTHVVDEKTHKLLVKNNNAHAVKLHRGMRVGRLVEIEDEMAMSANAFIVTEMTPMDLAERPPRRSHGKFNYGMKFLSNMLACAMLKGQIPIPPVETTALSSLGNAISAFNSNTTVETIMRTEVTPLPGKVSCPIPGVDFAVNDSYFTSPVREHLT